MVKRKTMIQNRLEMCIDTLTNSIDKVYGFNSRLKKNERERKDLRDGNIANKNKDIQKKNIDKLDTLLNEWDRLDLEIELEKAKQQKIKSLILKIEDYV